MGVLESICWEMTHAEAIDLLDETRKRKQKVWFTRIGKRLGKLAGVSSH